jgi:TPR repeat protein
VPTFSSAEIAALLARGDWLFATGDVASARLLYERAAGVGEARAAVKLGETFDPAFLSRRNLRGARADPAMAVFWYRRARDLGASDAGSRLIRLEAKQGELP